MTESPTSAAIRFLLECARVQADLTRLRRAAERISDWNSVLQAASAHRVAPLAFSRLRTTSHTVPPTVLASLEVQFRSTAARNLTSCGELGRVMGWLESSGIRVLAFKGPTLAVLAYPTLAVRPFGDLDLLLAPESRERAVEVLMAHGCAPKGASGATELTGNIEITMHTPSGYEIDLHWDLSPRYFVSLDAAPAWDRAVQVHAGGMKVRTLAPEDLLLCLAIHGARHCWEALIWICDIAQILANVPLNWDLLLADSRHRRALGVAVLLGHQLLDAPVPREILTLFEADRTGVGIAEEVQGLLLRSATDVAGTPRGAWMHLRLSTTLRERATYVWRRAFEPNQLDNDCFRSPAFRSALPLLRPLRILSRAVRAGRLAATRTSASDH